MFKRKRNIAPLIVNMYEFDQLLQRTLENAMWLREYFRLNFIYYQLISGKGLEFDRLRDYYVGADPRRMDWKKFAKTSKLLIRSFKEERQFDVVVVIDVSDTMLLGTSAFTKNEFAAMVAGTLMFAAYESGDNTGVVMFSDKVRVATEPGEDYIHLMSLIADKANYGGNKDWKWLSDNISINYGPDTIVFIVSDFIDTNIESFLPDLAARFAKVYGIMVRDPIDHEIPKGVGRMCIQDVHGEALFITDLEQVRLEYALLARRNVERIKEAFREYGQLFFNAKPGDSFGKAFIEALGSEEVGL